MEILHSEAALRLLLFGGVLALMAVWEVLSPRRHLTAGKPLRWLSNLALVGLNTLVVRVALPLGAVGVAMMAEARGWGVLANLDLPPWLVCALAVVALDFAIYLQHVLFHAVPLLWRLHRVHHADLDVDVTTGVRFHPFEILISLLVKIAVVILFGIPVVGVLLFEVVLNATSMFNHSNVALSQRLDRLLRL